MREINEVDLKPPAMPDPGEGYFWHIKDNFMGDLLELKQKKSFLGIKFSKTIEDVSYINYKPNRESYQKYTQVLGNYLLNKKDEHGRYDKERDITIKEIND